MEESHPIVKIPLMDTVFDELDDAFIGQPQTAHDFVWTLIRGLCKDAKMGKLNKACSVNVMKKGAMSQEVVKLRGLELEEVDSNPAWIPPNIEKDELKYFEHKVTDKTMEYLRLFCSFTLLRHQKYNASFVEHDANKITEMEAKKMDSKVIDGAKKTHEEGAKKRKDEIPTCMEEVLFNALYPQIFKKVSENIEVGLNKENEQIYSIEKPAPKPKR